MFINIQKYATYIKVSNHITIHVLLEYTKIGQNSMYTNIFKVYQTTQSIPKCSKYTTVCKVYQSMQIIPDYAKYTQE